MSTTTVKTQIEQVLHLRDDEDMTFAEIGSRLGFSERTARRRYEAGVLHRAADELGVEEDLVDFPAVPELNIVVDSDYIPEDKLPIERFQPLTRSGDALVICDLHIPLHDPILINKMIRVAQENDIKQLIIAGDYFNMEEFSSYLPYQPEAALDLERHDGNLIMKTLCRSFDEVDFIWGNHDFRLSKKLGFKKSFDECMRWMLSELTEEEFAKIRFSELDYMHYFPVSLDSISLSNLGSWQRKFRIMHPRNFSSQPLTVGRKLAQKFDCSVITAHSHHCAIGMAPNGRDIVIEGGGFFDKTRTEYIQKSTTHHEWVQGFTMFKDGIPTLFSPAFGNI